MKDIIYKYELELIENQTLTIPRGVFLSCQNQRGNIVFWQIEQVGQEKEKRTFQVVPTGKPHNSDGIFFGTVQFENFVWHVFERFEYENE
jgi:hypothetical protein